MTQDSAAKPPHASLARAAPSLARTAPSLARAVPKPLSVFANDLLPSCRMPAIAGRRWRGTRYDSPKLIVK